MQRVSGFTLIEIVVSVAIFALIGIGCYSVIHGITNTKERVEADYERTTALARAMRILDNDFNSIVARSIKDENNLDVAAFRSSTMDSNYLLEFTRNGYPNPLMANRSSLVRVAYAFKRDVGSDDLGIRNSDFDIAPKRRELFSPNEGGFLVRYMWPVLDRNANAKPIISVVMKHVTQVEFSYLDKNMNWDSDWLPTGSSGKPELLLLPYTIRLKVTSKDIGEVTRLFLITQIPPERTN